MHPYSNRHSRSGSDVLTSGDFESVEPAFPAPPRVPVFHRSAPPQHYAHAGQGHAPQSQSYPPGSYAPQQPYAYGAAPLSQSVPAPPSSLAPVAMSAELRNAMTTGPRAAQTVVIKERPGMRAGLALVAIGALVGGILGVGMRVHQNATELAATHQPAAVQASMPAAPQFANAPVAASEALPQAPAGLPPQYANLPPGAVMVNPNGTIVPIQPPVVVPSAKVEAKAAKFAHAPKADKADKAEKADKADRAERADKNAGGGQPAIAAKVTAPPKADKAPPPPEKNDKAADKGSSANKGGGRDKEAEDVLKAATAETKNSL